MPRLKRTTRHIFWSALLVGLTAASAFAIDPKSEEFFEKKIRPVLAGSCFKCHGGEQKLGGELRVDSRASLVKGGESGSAIEASKPADILLLKAIRREKDVAAMPPDGKLSAEQVGDFEAWIGAGAPWPAKSAKFDYERHWSFQPIAKSALPSVKNQEWIRTNLDRYILARMEAANAKPAPHADRRTLIRRATYDLTGLPPSAAEVEAFEKDPSPKAWENVVDRLLASPHYGEHWGRHWLDVVRYADTAGENSDHPLPHAWRYRNWVIRALNDDLPYNDFIRLQLAGDLLAAEGPPEQAAVKIIATGYLAVARRFGHEIDKELHLTFEDTIDNLGKSMLGLSIGCARCHDHKFDPISVRDYYGLYGIFDSTRYPFPGCEPEQLPKRLVLLPLPPAEAKAAAEIDQQVAAIDAESAKLAAEQLAAARLAKDLFAKHSSVLSQGEFNDGGSAELAAGRKEGADPRQVKKGEVIHLVVLPRGNYGADTTLLDLTISEVGGSARRWSLGDLVPDLITGNPHADRLGNPDVWWFLDTRDLPIVLPESLSSVAGSAEVQAWRNVDQPSVFVNRSEQPVKTWTTLGPKQFFAHPGPNGPVSIAWVSPIDGTVSIQGKLADAHPGGGDGVGWRLEHVASPEVGKSLAALLPSGQKLAEGKRRRAELLAKRPAAPLAYAVAEGTPHHAKIQRRGEPADLGDEVPRKFLDVLGGKTLQAPAASGRRELAEWIVDPANPLTARVIVNRVWLWHFGRGLVATANDFGSRGAKPSHPALLDHLAQEFMASGWSLKALHRQILLSSTWQQSAGAADPDGLYLAFPCRRLSAEELRDTLLSHAGDLDRVPGEGHPFPPQEKWNYTQHAPFAAEYESRKRSIYQMQKRNRRSRYFALFDGADPNASVPLREVTTVPTQALFFLNDPLVHDAAAKFAARVLASSPDENARLDFAFRQVFGRSPSGDEVAEARQFLRDYTASLADRPEGDRLRLAWEAFSRTLLGSNEVLHVD